MDMIDATTPADFPEQVIMMDKELGARHPTKTFYLRVSEEGGGAKHVDLDNAVTPVGARRMAREKGYDPTHWMVIGDRAPQRFY